MDRKKGKSGKFFDSYLQGNCRKFTGFALLRAAARANQTFGSC